MSNKPFWKSTLMGVSTDFDMHWAEISLAQKAFVEGKTNYHFVHKGTLRDEAGLTIDSLTNELVMNYGLRLAFHQIGGNVSVDDVRYLVRDDMVLKLDYSPKNRLLVFFGDGLDEKAMRGAFATAKARLTVRKVTKGRIYVVVQGDHGPYLHEMGTAGETFIPDNYGVDVVREYRHIVEDLNSDEPCGRIIILDGPPGTGKTHMVRALLNEAPKATFVLIPSNMLSNLGSPSFIKALLNEQKKGYPMILVIEDADEAIASRDRANLSEISALLNFSDGIFGAMMDLRIVCTTNADVKDLDEAVMRHGRLCRRIEVGKLDHVQAEAVYRRLGGTQEGLWTRGNFYTLGEVYYAVKGSGGALGVPKRAKGKLGFSMDVEESPVAPAQSTAAEAGLAPGDVITTDQGDIVKVREDGELEMVKMGPIGTRVDLDELFGDDDDDDEETPVLGDDDDDLIDEDP